MVNAELQRPVRSRQGMGRASATLSATGAAVLGRGEGGISETAGPGDLHARAFPEVWLYPTTWVHQSRLNYGPKRQVKISGSRPRGRCRSNRCRFGCLVRIVSSPVLSSTSESCLRLEALMHIFTRDDREAVPLPAAGLWILGARHGVTMTPASRSPHSRRHAGCCKTWVKLDKPLPRPDSARVLDQPPVGKTERGRLLTILAG